MKRLAFLFVLVAGCSAKPCAVTSDCGSGEACVAARCAALSCDQTTSLVNPATGVCMPVSVCVDHASITGWQACADPCASLDEHACNQSPQCQAIGTVGSGAGGSGGGAFDGPGGYAGCRGVPQAIDPCTSRDPGTCASDSRCELGVVASGCTCSSGTVCDCPPPPAPSCQLKRCDELTNADDCNARTDCTTSTPPPQPGPLGAPLPQTPPSTVSCFPVSGCQSADERTCAKQHACRPVYEDGTRFGWCVAEDVTVHCVTSSDCDPGQRCNANGVCVVAGCAGENETECNADLACEPIYSLNCSPYANGGGGSFCGPNGAGGGAPLPDEAPAPGSCTCEPTFSGCQNASGGVVTGKSVMVRDPKILDDAYWALPRVLTSITGADASAVTDAWLQQLGTATTVGTLTANARTGAAQYFAALPHRSDGLLDATRLGFVVTSLSNRLDLADTASCGEARITYALAAGATDRRHRMTVIVELRQPYDGAGCRAVAQQWLALGALDGAALQSALQAIYAPLLSTTNLKQVRTNEFLVGPQDPTLPLAAWELREFHLGSDARLHQVLLPLQVDPAAVQSSTDFLAWAQANRDGLAHGTVTFPSQYQVPTGSEDGSRIALTDGTIADLVNHSTCAGCHTTATNSAFAHVAERFGGTGRAEISQFLEGELQKRASHLALVAAGVVGAPLDVRPLH